MINARITTIAQIINGMFLLFLGSGSVIHGMHHEQDIRQMGGLRKKMKLVTVLVPLKS